MRPLLLSPGLLILLIYIKAYIFVAAFSNDWLCVVSPLHKYNKYMLCLERRSAIYVSTSETVSNIST